jgi:hypothetical protein
MQVMKKRMPIYKLLPFLGIAILLLACVVPALSVPTVSTPAPDAVETTIFETAMAARTQTAELLPPTQTATNTPTTKRPTFTPLPTSTDIVLPPTYTPVVLPSVTLPGGGGGGGGSDSTKTPSPNTHNYKGTLACALVGKNPSDGTVFNRREKFVMRWTVKNTGTASWKKHTIDYRYLGGDKFHDRKLYDFKYILDPGETYTIELNFRAPREPGNYETIWVVGLNKGGLCKMTLAIVVR